MKQDFKILVVEPNQYHARLIQRELSETYPSSIITVVSSAHAALGELRRDTFDTAVIGLNLPDVDGVGFVELVRKENSNLPIIVTTDSSSNQAGAAAAKAGANEYLSKDSSFHQVLSRLVNQVYRRWESAKKQCKLDAKQKSQEQADLIRITAGTLYHEINNPLTTIIGMSELILNNGYECDREIAKKVKIIRKSAQRIESSLARLSTISRPTIKETASGRMIDPQKSRVRRNQEPEGVFCHE
jgi:DNA-binding NarL/FixJ family response regulator